MASIVGELLIKVGLDEKEATKGLEQLEKKSGQIVKGMEKLGSTLTKSVTLPLIGLGTLAVKAADDQIKAEAALANAIKITGKETEISVKELNKLAGSLQQVTQYGDDAQLSALALVQQYASLDQDGLKKVLPAMLDFAAATKTDLQSAAMLFGKTLGSSTNALGRYGVQIDTTATSSQKLAQLTDGVNAKFKDAAKTFASAGLGPLTLLKNQLGELAEQFGMILIPILKKIIGTVSGWVKSLQEMSQGQRETILKVAALAAAIGPLLIVMAKMVPVIKAVGIAMSFLAANPIVAAIIALAAVIGVIIAKVVAWSKAQKENNDALLQGKKTAQEFVDATDKRNKRIDKTIANLRGEEYRLRLLEDEYQSLSTAQVQDERNRARQAEIMEELKAKFGESIINYNNEGKAIGLNKLEILLRNRAIVEAIELASALEKQELAAKSVKKDWSSKEKARFEELDRLERESAQKRRDIDKQITQYWVDEDARARKSLELKKDLAQGAVGVTEDQLKAQADLDKEYYEKLQDLGADQLKLLKNQKARAIQEAKDRGLGVANVVLYYDRLIAEEEKRIERDKQDKLREMRKRAIDKSLADHKASLDKRKSREDAFRELQIKKEEEQRARIKKASDDITGYMQQGFRILQSAVEGNIEGILDGVLTIVAAVGSAVGGTVGAIVSVVASALQEIVNLFAGANKKRMQFEKDSLDLQKKIQEESFDQREKAIEAELQAELKRRGLADKTKLEQLREQLAQEQDQEKQAEIQKEIEKYTIIEQYDEKRRQLENERAEYQKKITLLELELEKKKAMAQYIGKKRRAEIEALYNELIALVAAEPVPAAAEGGIVPARPGGQIVRVAEAGAAEAILPLTDVWIGKLAGAIRGAMPAGGSDEMMHLTVAIDSKPLLDKIFPATRNREVLISAGAVV